MTIQELRNKRGEVEFRRLLYQQQVGGEAVLKDELDASEIEGVLHERMQETRTAIGQLSRQGVVISPYLEIGAERGQRALVLENDLCATGAALDLSHDLLRSCEHYAQRFAKPKLPFRVCADAYQLPFRTGSLPFVFCYQTLHHFPDLDPIVAEIHRVLAPGGHFFFAEEPYRRVLHWRLIRTRGTARRENRGRLHKLLRALFVEESYTEEEYGVLENHDIPLGVWKAAMRRFDSGSATLSLDRFVVDAYRPRNPLAFAALYLLGGRLSGLYRKAGELRDHASSIEDALISPLRPNGAAETPLTRGERGFDSATGERYPVVDGIAMLMPPEGLAELYPEMATD
jgi:SAM-dependent methyltransferase